MPEKIKPKPKSKVKAKPKIKVKVKPKVKVKKETGTPIKPKSESVKCESPKRESAKKVKIQIERPEEKCETVYSSKLKWLLNKIKNQNKTIDNRIRFAWKI